MSSTRLRELDQIIFTNSVRNIRWITLKKPKKQIINDKDTFKPYLHSIHRPEVHQLTRQYSTGSPNVRVYNTTTDRKCQTTRIGLLLLILSICLTSTGIGMQSDFAIAFKLGSSNSSDRSCINASTAAPVKVNEIWTILLAFIISGPIMDYFGRRSTLILAVIPTTISWVLQVTPIDFIFDWGQFFVNLSIGFKTVSIIIYTVECADSFLRGVLICFIYVFYFIGQLIINTLSTYLSLENTVWCGISLSILTFIVLFTSPESPIWLISNGDSEKAYRALRWLRGNRELAQTEFDELVLQLERETPRGKTHLQNVFENRKTLKLVINVIILEIVTVVIGPYFVDRHLLSFIFGNFEMVFPVTVITHIVIAIILCPILYYMHRRTVFITASLIAGLSLLIFQFHTQYYLNAIPLKIVAGFTLEFISIALFLIMNVVYSMVPSFVIGELLPAKRRGSIAAFIFASIKYAQFYVCRAYFVHNEVNKIMIFVGFVCLVTSTIIYLTVPETNRKSLSEIADYSKDNKWFHRNRRQIHHQISDIEERNQYLE